MGRVILEHSMGERERVILEHRMEERQRERHRDRVRVGVGGPFTCVSALALEP